MNKQLWAGKTQGGTFGLWFLTVIFKYVDVIFIYILLVFIIPFNLIFTPKGRKAIYSYFRECQHYSILKSSIYTYLNHYKFGQVFLDRFVVGAGKIHRFSFDFSGKEVFDELLDGDKGFVIASSHVGNFELAGYIFNSTCKRINGLFYGGEVEQMQKFRKDAFGKNNFSPIIVSNDFSHIFAINNALKNNEIVTMVCDRFIPGNKFIIRNFLGKDAKFPTGFAHFAVQCDVPVIVSFVIKISFRHYKVFFKKIDLSQCSAVSNNEKVEYITEQYIHILESMVKMYPLQWFNFYNFWEA